MASRAYIFNKTYITSRDCKDLNYIICFNFDKRSHYASTYTKSKKKSYTSDNWKQPWQIFLVLKLFSNELFKGVFFISNI